MAERLVILIENDPVLRERYRAALGAYHLRTEEFSDGNQLLFSKGLEPALIILCIDPKRLGWAICNRLKRAPQFRGVPVIVTSQEATQKDFEDHSKLPTRVDEYLHKPFGVEILLDKMASLIGLDPPLMEESGTEEISIDDAEVLTEELLAEEEDEMRVADTRPSSVSCLPPGELNAVELTRALEEATEEAARLREALKLTDRERKGAVAQLKRHETGAAHVVPVIIRPVHWHDSPLGKLQALPTDGNPVTKWSDPDDAWLDIASGLRRVIDLCRR